MDPKKSLRTLEEWDRDVSLGLVAEPPNKGEIPSTGIECPRYLDVRGNRCRAHLADLPVHVYGKGGEIRRAVYCQVCHWTGSRRIVRLQLVL